MFTLETLSTINAFFMLLLYIAIILQFISLLFNGALTREEPVSYYLSEHAFEPAMYTDIVIGILGIIIYNPFMNLVSYEMFGVSFHPPVAGYILFSLLTVEGIFIGIKLHTSHNYS